MALRDEPPRRPHGRAAIEAKIARLGRGREARTRCTWPGGALEFELSVLTQAERSQAEADALRVLSQRGIDLASQSRTVAEAITVETAVHILAAAMRDLDGARLFVDAAELSDVATDDEIEKLAELYARHRNSSDPNLDALSPAELAEIDEALKKKDLIRFSSIASAMPKDSLLTLVAMLAISLIGRSMSIACSSQQGPSDPLEPQSQNATA